MGEVVIWQMFWRSLPWDFRTLMVKVSKHASSKITLATATALTHSWALHSEKGFLPLPDTKSYPPHGATKQLGHELYVGFTRSKYFSGGVATVCWWSSHFVTKPRGSLNESISITDVWGNNSGAGNFWLPISWSIHYTKKSCVSLTGLPTAFWGVLSQIIFLTWKTRIRGLKHIKGFKFSQLKC